MDYLADTQVFIWAIVSPEKLKPIVQNILQTNTIWVSQISLFEIAIKQKINKLPELSLPVEALISQLYRDGFQLMPLRNTHIAAYESIPLFANHRDPFDRLLIASALEENLTIISADEQFREYVPQIRLLEA
ncbi:type II toxin-antitoxin system VapC family toxin [Spirosoma sp. RP8]|uniref:Type II toxin-antitoxin system VapC family toxin n=1 Tax=Spirosoma liriopis TaxID=2937440 RepID=A0ABT0HSG6_9BACT|nr:type II toxin-antitoxin system VapC family toxin [Spirosoma liriopis]MCK8495122.1 type II toxin-antitoxin system VapC family toxin [Spirosoma liriopis]